VPVETVETYLSALFGNNKFKLNSINLSAAVPASTKSATRLITVRRVSVSGRGGVTSRGSREEAVFRKRRWKL
jgi:hypothetical protein